MTTCATAKVEEIRIAGKTLYVPSAEICDQTVVVTGKWFRTAQVKDEDVVEGVIVNDPELFITRLKESELKADVFTFAQRPPEITPKYHYHCEWDNWAAIRYNFLQGAGGKVCLRSHGKMCRRAARRGVIVKIVPFDDQSS